MTLEKEYIDWADKTFPDTTIEAIVHHMWEEIHETIDENSTANHRHETADVAMLFLHLTSKLGIEVKIESDILKEAVVDKWEICKNRTWAEPDENGVIRHVK